MPEPQSGLVPSQQASGLSLGPGLLRKEQPGEPQVEVAPTWPEARVRWGQAQPAEPGERMTPGQAEVIRINFPVPGDQEQSAASGLSDGSWPKGLTLSEPQVS